MSSLGFFAAGMATAYLGQWLGMLFLQGHHQAASRRRRRGSNPPPPGRKLAPPPDRPTAEELENMAKMFGLVVNDLAALSWLVVTCLAAYGDTPEPVPVSERLPEAEAGDLDRQGTCWMFHPINFHYCLCRPDPSVHTHWRPHWAIPLPATPAAGEVQP